MAESHVLQIAFLVATVVTHGTPDQQVRHAAGVLSLAEVVDVLAQHAFAPLNTQPPYVRNGALSLQEHLRRFPTYADVIIGPEDLAVLSTNAQTATTDQWNLLQKVRAIVPDADVTLRAHRLTWKSHLDAPAVTLFGVRVTRKVGPFTLQREYAAPDGARPDGETGSPVTPPMGKETRMN
jgi:hypothetical protein